MKNIFQFIMVCLIISFSSCKKDHSKPDVDHSFAYDINAQGFFTSGAISDTVQKTAINDFIISLKKDSLWNKFLAIYPMVGSNSATTSLNLKDPRNTDAAYRITWHGAPDFKTTGVTCLTSADWGDTHLVDTVLLYNNSSISYYSGTSNQTAGYDMGCSNSIYPYNVMAIYENFILDIVNTWFNAYGSVQYQPSSTVGLFTNSSTGGKVIRYDNGVAVGIYKAPDNAYTHSVITIGQVTDDSNIGLRECRLASIGSGLTDAEAIAFYKIVKTFETKLNR
ncbi:MAG: hypothetical protein ABI148_00350 [Ginsengibacter sp.]